MFILLCFFFQSEVITLHFQFLHMTELVDLQGDSDLHTQISLLVMHVSTKHIYFLQHV